MLLSFLFKNANKQLPAACFLAVVEVACGIRNSNTHVGRVLPVAVAVSSSPTRRRRFVAHAPCLENTAFSARAICFRMMFRIVSLVNCVLFTHVRKWEGTRLKNPRCC